MSFRYSCLFVLGMVVLLLFGVGLLLVIDELHKKLIIGFMMILLPIVVIYISRDAFSSKLILRIDNIGITDYRKNIEGKIILWSEIRMITLSRALYMGYSGTSASFNIYFNASKDNVVVPIGVWEIPAKELAEVIERHIKQTAPHIYIDWSSDTLPIIQ